MAEDSMPEGLLQLFQSHLEKKQQPLNGFVASTKRVASVDISFPTLFNTLNFTEARITRRN